MDRACFTFRKNCHTAPAQDFYHEGLYQGPIRALFLKLPFGTVSLQSLGFCLRGSVFVFGDGLYEGRIRDFCLKSAFWLGGSTFSLWDWTAIFGLHQSLGRILVLGFLIQ